MELDRENMIGTTDCYSSNRVQANARGFVVKRSPVSIDLVPETATLSGCAEVASTQAPGSDTHFRVVKCPYWLMSLTLNRDRKQMDDLDSERQREIYLNAHV